MHVNKCVCTCVHTCVCVCMHTNLEGHLCSVVEWVRKQFAKLRRPLAFQGYICIVWTNEAVEET